MKPSRHIQRLDKPREEKNNPYLSGIRLGGFNFETAEILNKIFSFPKMGSGFQHERVSIVIEDFLWLSLERRILSGKYKGVYYLTPVDFEGHVKQLIDILLEDENEANLFEQCGLKESLEGKSKTVGWVEIDNGFFFFTDEEMYKNTKKLFQVD